MTEQSIPDPTVTASEHADVDFGGGFFDEWIAGASPNRRSLTIYAKPGLYAEYEQVDRELKVARAVAKSGDEMAGSGVARLERRWQDIHDEWMASKSTWYVQQLGDDDTEAAKEGLEEPILEAPEEPEKPADLHAKASEQQAKSHTVRMNEYETQMDAYREALAVYEAKLPEHEVAREAWADEVNYRMIASALVEIRDANDQVRATSISVERLRKLAATFGKVQVLALMGAIQEATLVQAAIPAPFSQSTSEPDRT